MSEAFLKILLRLAFLSFFIAAIAVIYSLPLLEDGQSIKDFVDSALLVPRYFLAKYLLPYIDYLTLRLALDLYYFWITYHFFRFVFRP